MKRGEGVTQQAFSVFLEPFQKTIKRPETTSLHEYGEQGGVCFNPFAITEGALATNPLVTALTCIANYELLFKKRLLAEAIVPLTCEHPQSSIAS